MKFILGVIAALAYLGVADDSCPQSLQIKCVDDIRAGYEPCKKMAESSGADLPATLQCLKFYGKARSDCWPCICMIAKQDKVPIQGCDHLKLKQLRQ